MFSEGNPKSFNINISIISSTSSSTSRLEYKNSLIYLVRLFWGCINIGFLFLFKKDDVIGKTGTHPGLQQIKLSLITNLSQSFLLKIIPVIFYIYLETWDWLIYIGDSIGPVFHFKLRPLCVCPVFHSSGDSQ